MANVIHFNMIVHINQLLKEKGIDYSVHSVGGCTCAGLQLRQDGQEYPIEAIVDLMNDYLASQWMKVVYKEDNPLFLDIVSKFPYENK